MSAALLLTARQGQAQSDDPCAGLLVHGIYEHFSDTQDNASQSSMRKAVCDKYDEYRRSTAGGGVEVSFPVKLGTVGVEGSFSKEELTAIGKLFCEDDRSDTAAKAARSIGSKFISKAGADAYTECRALAAFGVKAMTTYTSDSLGTREVTISIRFERLPGQGPGETRQIKGVIFDTQEFACDGDLLSAWQARKKGATSITLDGGFQTLACHRKVRTVPVSDGTQTVLAKATSITISTDAGPVTRTLPPIFPEPPDWRRKIGEVVSSVLSEVQFTRAYGGGWVLADGRNVSGTAFARITGRQVVPDLRAQFLFGGPGTDVVEIGGARTVTLTVDQLPNHSHRLGLTHAEDDPANYQSEYNEYYAPNFPSHHLNNWRWGGSGKTGAVGSNQPVSIMPPFTTVNYYVRVDE